MLQYPDAAEIPKLSVVNFYTPNKLISYTYRLSKLTSAQKLCCQFGIPFQSKEQAIEIRISVISAEIFEKPIKTSKHCQVVSTAIFEKKMFLN